MSGFDGLVQKHFNGDRDKAASYVADLGRASFYYSTRPIAATNILAKWKDVFPTLFHIENDKAIGIRWKSKRLKSEVDSYQLELDF